MDNKLIPIPLKRMIRPFAKEREAGLAGMFMPEGGAVMSLRALYATILYNDDEEDDEEDAQQQQHGSTPSFGATNSNPRSFYNNGPHMPPPPSLSL